MILLNSQIHLYYNLRNLFLILGIAFVLAGIGYGVQVHMIVIVQKYFGIEKRREIAKRRAAGYTGRSSTAKMRALQYTAGRSGGMSPAGKIDVSQVTTEKMKQSGGIAAVPEKSVALPEEGTAVLAQTGDAEVQPEEGTMILPRSEETTVLSQEKGRMVLPRSEETTVLSQEKGRMVLPRSEETTVLLQEKGTMVLQNEQEILVVHGEDIC